MKAQPIWYILFPILSTAAVARFYGIGFGLPDLLHLDEPFEINRALRLASGEFDFKRAGKGGLYYLLFLEMGSTFVLLFLTGVINSIDQFIDYYIRNEHVFYLFGRMTIAVTGVLSVYLIYKIGEAVGDRKTGTVAAFFLAVSPLHIINSHYATVDILMVFFMSLVWFCFCKILEHGDRRYYVVAGCFYGLSMITKSPAILLFVPIVFVYLFSVLETRTRLNFNNQTKNMFILLCVAGVVTTVGEPGYVVGIRGIFGLALKFFSKPEAAAPAAIEVPVSEAALQSGGARNVYAYYFDALREDVGIPMLVLFASTLIYGMIRKDRFVCLMLSFVVVYLFVICGTTRFWHYERYLLPVLPIIFLVSALGIARLTDVVKTNIGYRNAYLFSGILAILIMSPIYVDAIEVSRHFGLPNTKVLAKRWINENIQSGTRIMMEGSPEHRSQFMVPIANNRENVEEMIAQLQKNNTGKARYWRKRNEYLNSLDLPRYDIAFVHNSEYWPTMQEIKKQGVEYLVVNVSTLSMGVSRDMGYLTSRIAFYLELTKDDTVERVMAFQAGAESTGPTLEIYKFSTHG